jgi:hypothetical protein
MHFTLTVIATLRTANQSAIKIVGLFQKGLCAMIYVLLLVLIRKKIVQ